MVLDWSIVVESVDRRCRASGKVLASIKVPGRPLIVRRLDVFYDGLLVLAQAGRGSDGYSEREA